MRVLLLLCTCLALPLAALADAPDADDAVSHTVGGDRFSAGGSVEIRDPVAGNLFVAGGEVTVAAPVAGAAFAAGGHLEIQGPIEKDLYAAGGSLTVSSVVRHNARLLGETIDLTPAAKIDGSASLAGRAVTVAGEVEGKLEIAARDALINGSVAGDVEVSGEHIEIGPQARIGGHLRYRGQAPVVAPGAQIAGGIEQLSGSYRHFGWREGTRRAASGVGRVLWLSGLAVLGALLLLIGPVFMREASTLVRREWPLCLGIGLGIVFAVPVVVVLLFITLIGIPVGLLAIALYAVLLVLGYVCGVIALGDLALERLAPAREATPGLRILALLAMLVALALVRHVPLVGGLAVAAMFLVGVGALAKRVFRSARPASAV